MLVTQERRCEASYLSELRRDAWVKGVSGAVADEACRATARMVCRSGIDPESPQGARRVTAYFAAVVKRRTLSRESSAEAAAPYLIAADLADLRAVGRDTDGVWEELRRSWASRVSEEVLERYRAQLCG